jgi:hypothetical protein
MKKKRQSNFLKKTKMKKRGSAVLYLSLFQASSCSAGESIRCASSSPIEGGSSCAGVAWVVGRELLWWWRAVAAAEAFAVVAVVVVVD